MENLHVLKKLDAITERISKLEATATWNLDPIFDVHTCTRKSSVSGVKIVDQIRDMSLGDRPINVILSPDVKLTVADL